MADNKSGAGRAAAARPSRVPTPSADIAKMVKTVTWLKDPSSIVFT
jgi:hypothetical protein